MISLISTQWLKTELANGFGSACDQIIVEVGCGAPDRSDHIAGSIWLDTNQVETEERCWSLVEDDLLLARLGERGVSHESDVVIAGELGADPGRRLPSLGEGQRPAELRLAPPATDRVRHRAAQSSRASHPR